MLLTYRAAHLAERPKWKVGDVIRRGDKIGRMGNTGKSTGAHVHEDCVEGIIPWVWRLSDMEKGYPNPCPKQLNYFLDDEFFGVPLDVTTWYCDYRYGKIHHAYDVVPADRDPRHFDFFWNRTPNGKVIAIGEDSGYGIYVHIGFEV